MENVPVEVSQRLEGARGAPLDLWVEPDAPGGVRVTLVFHVQGQQPLGVTVHRLFEAQWPFGGRPVLRVVWRLQSLVRDLRLSTVQNFALPGSDPAVRVDVELDGAAAIGLEGAQITIGPVPPPGSAAKSPVNLWDESQDEVGQGGFEA
ncbi:MAG: hypothetical protein Q8Q09_13175 [Deltaproteobacteria bacterium]|nr:hypothetical protein [Deltaproteobacteria bacterium]